MAKGGMRVPSAGAEAAPAKGSMRVPSAGAEVVVSATDQETGIRITRNIPLPKTRKILKDISSNLAGKPHSQVGVSLAYRMSKNYCSVEMSASVWIPCAIGKEEQALWVSKDIASTFLENSHSAVEETLDAISE